VAINWFAFNHKSDVAELTLVQNRKIVALLMIHLQKFHLSVILFSHGGCLTHNSVSVLGDFFRHFAFLVCLTLLAIGFLRHSGASACKFLFFFVIVESRNFLGLLGLIAWGFMISFNKIKHDGLLNNFLVLVFVHDQDSSVGQEHHALQHAFVPLIEAPFLVRNNGASSRHDL
jgi:hypothetical protein